MDASTTKRLAPRSAVTLCGAEPDHQSRARSTPQDVFASVTFRAHVLHLSERTISETISAVMSGHVRVGEHVLVSRRNVVEWLHRNEQLVRGRFA
jgi:excisionase family DNA binding protein